MTTIEELETRIRSLGSCVVAFSGGVDSSLVAALAARALGERALAVTAVSPALATGELDGAREVARADRHPARDDHDGRARAGGVPRERARPLLPLQDRALRPSSSRSQRAPGYAACCPARTPTTSATGGPGSPPPPSTASSIRSSRRESARRRCAGSRASSASRAPRSRRRRASRRASRTARRSIRMSLAQIDRAELAVKALGLRRAARAPLRPLGRVELDGRRPDGADRRRRRRSLRLSRRPATTRSRSPTSRSAPGSLNASFTKRLAVAS